MFVYLSLLLYWGLPFSLTHKVTARKQNWNVLYGKKDNTIIVKGPEFLVTDGTRELTLTCETNTSATVGYTWFFIDGDTKRCQSPGEVCTFRPRLEEDGQSVTCKASDLNDTISLRAFYTLNLKYPPSSGPTINRPSQTNALKQGDVITCTVPGGKPRVTNVMFHCQHPDLADQQDDVSIDGRDVNSSITVDTSQATEQNMTCTCSAHWAPEPGLYNATTNKDFILQYPPRTDPVISLQPNTTEPLTQGDVITCTVSGGKPRVTNVTFHCHHPDHADQQDNVSDDGRDVSSTITVNMSLATEQNMACTCSAHWAPEPGLYRKSTEAEFMLDSPHEDTSLPHSAIAAIVINVIDMIVHLVILIINRVRDFPGFSGVVCVIVIIDLVVLVILVVFLALVFIRVIHDVGDFVVLGVLLALGIVLLVRAIYLCKTAKKNKRETPHYGQGSFDNRGVSLDSIPPQDYRKVTATVQPHVHGRHVPQNDNDQPAGRLQRPAELAPDPGYACPWDMLTASGQEPPRAALEPDNKTPALRSEPNRKDLGHDKNETGKRQFGPPRAQPQFALTEVEDDYDVLGKPRPSGASGSTEIYSHIKKI